MTRSTLPFGKLTIRNMANGHLCLLLTEEIGWDSAPQYFKGLLLKISAFVVDKIETVDMRLWKVRIGDVELELVYSDFPNEITLESDSSEGDQVLHNLAGQLS